MQVQQRKIADTFLPASYEIILQGELDESWSSWLDGMTVQLEKDKGGRAVSILTGTAMDQSALYGLLSRIRDTGLLLLSVRRLNDPDPNSPAGLGQ